MSVLQPRHRGSHISFTAFVVLVKLRTCFYFWSGTWERRKQLTGLKTCKFKTKNLQLHMRPVKKSVRRFLGIRSNRQLACPQTPSAQLSSPRHSELGDLYSAYKSLQAKPACAPAPSAVEREIVEADAGSGKTQQSAGTRVSEY